MPLLQNFNLENENELISTILELNKISLMLYGKELNNLNFKNNDITDFTESNIQFKNEIMHNSIDPIFI